MIGATFYFPQDFLWGAATSSHQVEGNNSNNDWWEWEQKPGKILDGSRSGLASNWWQDAESDLDRAIEMGNNTHRMSIEWSRVEPEPGLVNRDALERYRQIIMAMRERNIEPMVTLHHFTNPLWLAEKGGWTWDLVVEHFAHYVHSVVEYLGDLVQLWVSINEPMSYVVKAYIEGIFPPGKKSFPLALQAARNMLQAHAAAYHTIHELHPYDWVGLSRNIRLFEPASEHAWLDNWAAKNLDLIFNERFTQAVLTGRLGWPLGRGRIENLARTLDFVGLDYYTREMVSFDILNPGNFFVKRFFCPEADISDNNFREFFSGIYKIIRRAAAYQRPIYITENGLPDSDDDRRLNLILTHLRQIRAAMQDNIPVMGYYHWSLVDIFEWDRGWKDRFGLIAIDPDTQQRTLRKSADLYRQICRGGKINREMVAEFAPELLQDFFP